MKSIALIGFMGAGKTTIGKLLSAKLDMKLIETDNEALLGSGFNSIIEVFETKGEKYFRSIEHAAIVNLIKNIEVNKGMIISCGGGTVENPDNMLLISNIASRVFLDASFKTLKKRIKHIKNARPLFMDEKKAEILYLKRLPLYKEYADIIIDTNGKSPEEICALLCPINNFTYL